MQENIPREGFPPSGKNLFGSLSVPHLLIMSLLIIFAAGIASSHGFPTPHFHNITKGTQPRPLYPVMNLPYIYFIYGLCVMFYFMMTWFFLRKNKEILSRLVAALMFVIGIQCIKDLFFITPSPLADSYSWRVMTVSDMVAVPLYAFILIELCRPGTLNTRTIIVHEAVML